jgi:N-acetyl-gamma-glutamyl-phosphate reductase
VHYAEANENVSAYALGGHRHLPEIVQELKAMDADFSPSVMFLPHLVPATRGILSSCYVRPKHGKAVKGTDELKQLYCDFYKDEPFVRISDAPPGTKHTWGSNLCIIHPVYDSRTCTMVIISCLDNLVKGAAGQAIQNMNIMFGFSETAGLEALPVYP